GSRSFSQLRRVRRVFAHRTFAVQLFAVRTTSGSCWRSAQAATRVLRDDLHAVVIDADVNAQRLTRIRSATAGERASGQRSVRALSGQIIIPVNEATTLLWLSDGTMRSNCSSMASRSRAL